MLLSLYNSTEIHTKSYGNRKMLYLHRRKFMLFAWFEIEFVFVCKIYSNCTYIHIFICGWAGVCCLCIYSHKCRQQIHDFCFYFSPNEDFHFTTAESRMIIERNSHSWEEKKKQISSNNTYGKWDVYKPYEFQGKLLSVKLRSSV